MIKNESKYGMPLKLWLWSLALSAFIISSILLILNYRTKYVISYQLNFIEHENDSEVKSERLDFYFIGSSLTEAALFRNNSIQIPDTLNGFKISYKATIIGKSQLSDFNYKIDEIKKLKPKYLFIESNLSCINMKSNLRARILLIPQNFMVIMEKLFNSTEINEQTTKNPEEVVDLANGILFGVRKINEFPLWNKLYEEAHELGIKIIFLEIPRSIEADQLILDDFKIKYNNLIEAYKKEYDIDYIEFPNKISRDKYYIDRAHFNEDGSIYYSNWLVNEFKRRNILITQE